MRQRGCASTNQSETRDIYFTRDFGRLDTYDLECSNRQESNASCPNEASASKLAS